MDAVTYAFMMQHSSEAELACIEYDSSLIYTIHILDYHAPSARRHAAACEHYHSRNLIS
jgi:hypothetical protein